MRVLVTGGTGFLGGAFVAAASRRGHEVWALSRRSTQVLDPLAKAVVCTDVRHVSADELPERLDAVVHFAAGTDGGEEEMVSVSVEGTLRVLAVAQACGAARFVHVSSLSVDRGDGRGREPHPERRGGYARAKTLAEAALVELLQAQPDERLDVVIVRPGLVFGVGMVNPLAGTAVQLPLGLAIGLGRPGQGVPFLGLEDLVDGLLALLETEPSPGSLQTFAMLSGEPPAKRVLVGLHRQLSGRPRRMIWIPGPIALVAAAALDLLGLVRRRSRWAVYTARRLYRFEPRRLSAEDFWDAVGERPRASLPAALAAALAPERPVHGSRAERALAETLRRRPQLTDVENGRPMPLILLGAGRVAAEMHLPVLRGLPGYRLEAIVDPSLALASQAAAAFHGCRAFADPAEVDDELWARAAAVVATPGFTHHTLAREALERGASVLLEKPAVLTAEEYIDLSELARRRQQPVTVFHNYRLRPGSRALWRFLAEHDVGALVRARLTFHSPPLEREQARWMRNEKWHRVLVMELAVHLLDLACAVGGELNEVRDLAVVDDPRSGATLSVTGSAVLAGGAGLDLDLDLSGVAARSQVVFMFERAACALDLFPDGFRVLPRRANPVDDLAADASRLAAAVWQRAKRSQAGVPKRALPHHEIYRRHLARLCDPSLEDPFSLQAVGPTLRSLFRLCELVYPPGKGTACGPTGVLRIPAAVASGGERSG